MTLIRLYLSYFHFGLSLVMFFFAGLPAQSAAQDGYEPDDVFSAANKIIIQNEAQNHDFHLESDADWVKFYAFEGESYTIEETHSEEQEMDVVLELYNEAGTLIKTQDTIADSTASETLELDKCPSDGVYYVKVRLYSDASFTDNNAYKLGVYLPIGPITGTITGNVLCKSSGQPVGDVIVKTDRKRADITSPEDGSYRLLDHPPDDFELETESGGKLLSYRVELIFDSFDVFFSHFAL